MDFNQDQQAVIENPNGARSVVAGPGSGKSTTMVGMIRRLLESGVSPADVRAVTFSKEMASVLERKLKINGIASTFHSLGYLICSETERKPVEPELRHRLMCKLCRKWKLDYKELDHFIARMREAAVSPAQATDRGEFGYGMTSAYAEYEQERHAAGWMDFSSMLADAVQSLEKPAVRARWQPQYLIVDEAQDTDNCHPPGTLVRKLSQKRWSKGHKAAWEEIPIENICNGDMLVSWNRHSAQLTYAPQPVAIGCRRFTGRLIQIHCGQKSVEVTPNHQVYVTLNGKEEGTWVVYLMWRSDLGFRIGQCRMRYKRSTRKKRESLPGLGHRFAEEKAQKGWILKVCKTADESKIWEQIWSCNFGIPYAQYGDRPYGSLLRKRSAHTYHQIFTETKGRGEECLLTLGLDFEYPLYLRTQSGERKSPSRRYFITSAINLRPEIMSLPSTEPCQQEPITSILSRPYSGPVYSLNVPKYHTYVANGLVVKNCQWRMMQLMAEKHGNITVVGDPGQAIYGFRGAKPDNITNFQQWFPTGRKYYLGKNYRSTQTIVKFVRENAPGDTPQELLDRMVASRAEVGVPIDFKMYWSEEQEAESALALANKDPLQSIILARTNRMVGLLERICNKHNVRYHLMGKTGFWKQNEIRKAIDLLKNYPTLETAAAMSLALPALVAKYAVDDRTERDNDAIENLGVLRVIGKDFRLASDFTTYANKMQHRRNDPKGVSISTCHQAKGGEWRNVYIIGASAKGFPHPKGDPREERRIWFVAISRATDMLRISFSGTPSPYLRRYLPDSILDKLREKAEEVTKLQAQHNLFA